MREIFCDTYRVYLSRSSVELDKVMLIWHFLKTSSLLGLLVQQATMKEKIQVLTDKIDVLLQKIEELGSEGKVEEAQGMMKLVEQLKEERELLRFTTLTIESFAAQEKQMDVCEVCGAFLIVGDAQSQVDDDLMGKQYMGYAKIKVTVKELKEKLRKRTEEPDRDERLKKAKQEREERKQRAGERKGKTGKKKDEEKRKKEKKKGEREVHGVDIKAKLLTGDAAGLGTTKDHQVETEGETEVEIHKEAEAMTDQKENIDLIVGIEDCRKAEIESHINMGSKVGTENKIENPRRKRRRDLMIKRIV